MVAERVTGESYGALVEAMFKRLGMRHSAYGCKAQGHQVQGGKVVPAKAIAWDSAFAAGGICSTAGDLLIWERALQRGDVISKTSLKAMTTPTRLADGTRIDYGLGTRLGMLGGHPTLGHTGGGAGFSAVLEYFPSDDLTVAVLADTGGTIPANAIAAAVARQLLRLPDTIADKPVAQPLDYAGVYTSGEGTLEVFLKDGKLAFRPPGTKEALGVLHYQGDDIFAIDADTQIRILRKDGKVTWAVGYDGGLMSDPKRRVQR
jgi:CubicO group peptidase (beta-lactamase class C family)